MFRFPWGDMHSLNLGWFLQKFNELRADWATAEENITGALDAEIQRAEDALSDVFDARDAAAASATAAAGSASSAGTSATAAQNSATAAGNSATLANNKATAAGLSEAAAAQSAAAAGNSATAAAGSATAAGQSATNAAASETAAGQSATTAGNSATAAAASAAAAEQDAGTAGAAAEEARQIAASIPADYTELSESVDALNNEKNPCLIWLKRFTPDYDFPTNSSRDVKVSGNIITLEQDGAESSSGRTWVLTSKRIFNGTAVSSLVLDDYLETPLPEALQVIIYYELELLPGAVLPDSFTNLVRITIGNIENGNLNRLTSINMSAKDPGTYLITQAVTLPTNGNAISIQCVNNYSALKFKAIVEIEPKPGTVANTLFSPLIPDSNRSEP